MDPNHLYIIVSSYLVYIIGLVFIPVLFVFKQYIKDVIQNNKDCAEDKKLKFCCWLKNRLLIPEKASEQLSLACFITGLGSIALSALSMLFYSLYPHVESITYNQLLSIFVGLWAPTLILLSLYFKK